MLYGHYLYLYVDEFILIHNSATEQDLWNS